MSRPDRTEVRAGWAAVYGAGEAAARVWDGRGLSVDDAAAADGLCCAVACPVTARCGAHTPGLIWSAPGCDDEVCVTGEALR